MLIDTYNLEILLCTNPTDMRKAINGLCLIVSGTFSQNPSCGTVYVFCNRLRNKLKLLYWDGNGFCLLYKRLEKGRFQLPCQGQTLSLAVAELRWLLQGLDFTELPKPSVLSVSLYE